MIDNDKWMNDFEGRMKAYEAIRHMKLEREAQDNIRLAWFVVGAFAVELIVLIAIAVIW